MSKRLWAVALVTGAIWSVSPLLLQGQTALIQETFENRNFASRGWYDSTGGALSTVEKFAGTSSFECRFPVGTTNCAGGDIARHKFPDTDSVYVSYYIKHSANWVGSGKSVPSAHVPVRDEPRR